MTLVRIAEIERQIREPARSSGQPVDRALHTRPATERTDARPEMTTKSAGEVDGMHTELAAQLLEARGIGRFGAHPLIELADP